MHKTIMEKMDLPSKCTKYWTDNEIVFHYLTNPKRRFQSYVANYAEEIRENSQPERWNHVPGFLNPADDVLRGLTPLRLNLNHRWTQGSDFLWRSASHWPNAALRNISVEELKLMHESHVEPGT